VSAPLQPLVDFYENLTPQTLGRIRELYAPDAYFKDPFNEVRGTAAIERIFRHMFEQADQPRFLVTERIAAEDAAMLVWQFSFRRRRWRTGETLVVRGATHLRFDASGRVVWHRDYWDAAEELYARLPLLGTLMRALQGGLRAR
jgi:hypothetical protein